MRAPKGRQFALRWMNGWAFGPDDFSNFRAEQNRPAGSAEHECGFHRFLAAHTECAGYILFHGNSLGPFTALSAAGGIRPNVYVGLAAVYTLHPCLARRRWRRAGQGCNVTCSLNATAYPC